MAQILNSTPKVDGFHFPAEFSHHKSCWIMYPERTDIYPHKARKVQQTYIELAEKISRFESVNLCVSKNKYDAVKALFPSNIKIIQIESDGNWLRDTGPTFLLNNKGQIRGVDWEFNAWGGLNGGCYFPWNKDNEVAREILNFEKIDYYKSNLVLEGGAILSDGEGTLLTTEETLLNPNRNPTLSKNDIEIVLKEYLSIDKIIWLKRGIYLDEAGGHIDGICCFIKPGVVALTWTEDKNDPQYEISVEALEKLESETDAKGRKLKVHKVHQPTPQYITKQESETIDIVSGTVSRNAGDRLPASYINFYFANNAIILPTFNDYKFDQLAIEQFKMMCPERQIVTIESRDILLGGGNIHCMTQQQPQY